MSTVAVLENGEWEEVELTDDLYLCPECSTDYGSELRDDEQVYHRKES